MIEPMATSDSASRPTPLIPVLVLSFLGSFGSGVIYNGIFSLAKWNYDFSEVACFWLGLLYGALYIPAALLVGPVLKRFPPGSRFFNHRALIGFIMLSVALLCSLPWLASLLDGPPGSARSSWPIWVLIAGYSPLSGMLWPLVESYVAGARSGAALRRAVGFFNIAWSSSLAIVLLAVSPLVKEHAVLLFSLLAAIHALLVIPLCWFTPRPGAHLHDDDHAHPPSYVPLHRAYQVLLLVAFIALTTLGPSIPTVCRQIGLSPASETSMISIWMFARVSMFILMSLWHGWRGVWLTPILGSALMLASAALVLLATSIAPPDWAQWVLVGGLIGFGVGLGSIYFATLYYTMTVGSAQVEAAGNFEALIGLGYAIGPLLGLLASGIVTTGAAGARAEPVLAGLLTLVCGFGFVAARSRARFGGSTA